MTLIPKNDVNQIFASQAPEQDKPAAFNNYLGGWGVESRPNNGKPTIKGFNKLQQRTDENILYIHQNGAALPFDENMEYAENAVVVKDGVLQQWKGGEWVRADLTLDSVLDMLTITNPKNGMRVRVKSFHAGLNVGGKEYVYNSSLSTTNNSGTVIRGWVAQGITYLDPKDFGATKNNTSTLPTDLYTDSELELIYGTDIDKTKTLDTIAFRKVFASAVPTTIDAFHTDPGGVTVKSDGGVS